MAGRLDLLPRKFWGAHMPPIMCKVNSQIPALILTNEEALEALKCKSNEEFKEPLSLSLDPV